MLALQGIRLSRAGRPVLDGVDLALDPGEIRVLVGASGAGKTTLLRVIAGFEAPEAGSVLLEGAVASAPDEIRVAPHHRGVGMAFQDDALWPHLSVREHLGFGRRALRRGADASDLGALLALVGLTERAGARPGQLSGGERQRLSIARALAHGPRLLLLDEPLAHVDLRGRRRLARALVAFLRTRVVTTLWVTHQPEELSFVGERASLLVDRKLEGPFAPGELRRLLEAED